MKIIDPKDIQQLGSILSIWAHPDDETWCAGGILAAASENGQKVCCITATNGEAGDKYARELTAQQLAATRQNELDAALHILGISCHHLLGYKDGSCNDESTAGAVAKLIPLIEHVQPDSIITFGPTGTTGHLDHITVSAWTSAALEQAKLTKPVKLYHRVESQEWYHRTGVRLDEQFDIFFNIDRPLLVAEKDMDICFSLNETLRDKKLAALRAQATQYEAMFKQAALTDLQDTATCEGFMLARTYQISS